MCKFFTLDDNGQLQLHTREPMHPNEVELYRNFLSNVKSVSNLNVSWKVAVDLKEPISVIDASKLVSVSWISSTEVVVKIGATLNLGAL